MNDELIREKFDTELPKSDRDSSVELEVRAEIQDKLDLIELQKEYEDKINDLVEKSRQKENELLRVNSELELAKRRSQADEGSTSPVSRDSQRSVEEDFVDEDLSDAIRELEHIDGEIKNKEAELIRLYNEIGDDPGDGPQIIIDTQVGDKLSDLERNVNLADEKYNLLDRKVKDLEEDSRIGRENLAEKTDELIQKEGDREILLGYENLVSDREINDIKAHIKLYKQQRDFTDAVEKKELENQIKRDYPEFYALRRNLDAIDEEIEQVKIDIENENPGVNRNVTGERSATVNDNDADDMAKKGTIGGVPFKLKKSSSARREIREEYEVIHKEIDGILALFDKIDDPISQGNSGKYDFTTGEFDKLRSKIQELEKVELEKSKPRGIGQVNVIRIFDDIGDEIDHDILKELSEEASRPSSKGKDHRVKALLSNLKNSFISRGKTKNALIGELATIRSKEKPNIQMDMLNKRLAELEQKKERLKRRLN